MLIAGEKLENLVKRMNDVSDSLSTASSSNTIVALSKEFAELEPVAKKAQALLAARSEYEELTALGEDPDPAMQEMMELEQKSLVEKRDTLEAEMRILLLPKDAADEKSAILEVRAGTGGDEAALFAGNLFDMYQRYSALHDWKVEVMSVSDGAKGGYKEIIASITGRNVFARLKFESGVHRVQRVPDTETQGRVHTSAATVAVLPEAEEVDIQINENDLRIDVFRSSGPGGQSVNTTDSAVRIVHLPTGVTVQQQDEKSQHKNKAKALKVLRARLYDLEYQKRENERSSSRKGQIGSGDRSERIRTYNYPQGRVSDHRIELTLYKLEQIMLGEALDEIIDAMISDHQAALLSDVGAGD